MVSGRSAPHSVLAVRGTIMDEQKNVFVVGLNDFNHERLKRLRGAENYRFHGVIAPEAVYDTEVFDIAAMLKTSVS